MGALSCQESCARGKKQEGEVVRQISHQLLTHWQEYLRLKGSSFGFIRKAPPVCGFYENDTSFTLAWAAGKPTTAKMWTSLIKLLGRDIGQILAFRFPLSLFGNLLQREGPQSQEGLAGFWCLGCAETASSLVGLVPGWGALQRWWLLTDGPIYIKGSYYAWNHSSIICFGEFNQSIFQFLSGSGSEANEGSQVGFIWGQWYLPPYLQQICLKSMWKYPFGKKL